MYSNSLVSLTFQIKKMFTKKEEPKMVVTMNALELIDAELARASAPRSANKKPIFLFLKENHKALIRPLYELKSCLVLAKHNKFSENPNERVNSICASEIDQTCTLCQKAQEDKKLNASVVFYLPVYVYGVVDQVTTHPVTYKEKVDDREVELPIKGIRLLEMTPFGTVGQILKYFREFSRDTDNCGLTDCDFTLTQVGSGQKKSFVIMPRAAKPIDPRIAKIIPVADRLRERILEALPPMTLSDDEETFNVTAIDKTSPNIVSAMENDDIREF